MEEQRIKDVSIRGKKKKQQKETKGDRTAEKTEPKSVEGKGTEGATYQVKKKAPKKKAKKLPNGREKMRDGQEIKSEKFLWKVNRLLGSGGFGDVYKVMKKNDDDFKDYAMKTEMAKGDKRMLRLKIEVTVLQSCWEVKDPEKRRYFVEFVDKGITDKFKFMVMGLVGPSLEDIRRQYILRNYSKPTAMNASIQTLRAMADPLPEIVKETLCYFRLNSLRDHGFPCNNPLTPKILKIEADKLATGWSAFINEVLAAVRPKILRLQVFEQEFQEGNRLDIELLKTLNMDEISIRDGTLCNDRLNYLLKTVAPFTKRLQIRVTSIDRTEFHVTKNSIRALVQMVMDNEHGRFQHFHLSYPRLHWALEFDDQFSPISNYERAHKDFPDKSVAWTIPLKQGFIFVNTACYNNELHFEVVVCPDFESLQNWYNGHPGEATRNESLREWYWSHAKECTRNIAEIWERGNGRGSTCQRNVPKRRAPARAAALKPPQRPVPVNNSKKTTTLIKTRGRRLGCFTDKNGRLRDKKGRFVKTK